MYSSSVKYLLHANKFSYFKFLKLTLFIFKKPVRICDCYWSGWITTITTRGITSTSIRRYLFRLSRTTFGRISLCLWRKICWVISNSLSRTRGRRCHCFRRKICWVVPNCVNHLSSCILAPSVFCYILTSRYALGSIGFTCIWWVLMVSGVWWLIANCLMNGRVWWIVCTCAWRVSQMTRV